MNTAMIDFVNDILAAGNLRESNESGIREEYWGLTREHISRILSGALALDILDLSPQLVSIDVNYKKGTLAFEWSPVKESNKLSEEQKRELFAKAIERLHKSGWAHGSIDSDAVLFDDSRVYLIGPQAMFRREEQTPNPEPWLSEWIKKGYDLCLVDDLVDLDYEYPSQ